MIQNLKIPVRLQLIARAIVTFFVLFALLRSAFFFAFKNTSLLFTTREIATAFQIGFRFDLRLALFVVLPLAVLGWMPIFNPQKKTQARFWLGYFVAMTGFMAIVYALDFGFYAYLNGRLNATILKFTENPFISAEMIWQSYPLVWITLGWFAGLGLMIFVLKRFVFAVLPAGEAEAMKLDNEARAKGLGHPPWKRVSPWVKGALIVFIYFAGLWGHFSQYPLRWSEAFFSGNTFVAATALNPVLYFVDTIKTRQKNYDEKLVRAHYQDMSKFLGVDEPSEEALRFLRAGRVAPAADRSVGTDAPNVIYIIMESFAAYRSKHFGGQFDATPHFDELADQGTLFTNFFVPSEATARSLFAVFTALPDVGVGLTSSRNPLVVNQNSLINAFKAHKKFYFIGGSASWGNIRGVVANNVDQVEMIEEGQYKAPRTDVWGVSDLAMFKEADERFQQTKEPFFAVIQTAGFHRPYTIPEVRDGFELKTLTQQQLDDGGYNSLAEYNSLRFSDFSLWRFIEIAKKSPYFKNTLFVIHGDHGLPSGRATSVSKGTAAFGLTRWHVPLLLYGPSVMPTPRKIDKIASELDVVPTLAAWAGQPALNNSLGRDLFDPKFDQDRSAFLYVWYQTPPQIGVITDKAYTFGTPGAVHGYFDYRSETPQVDLTAQHPDEAKALIDHTEAFHETAKYLLYHNPRLKQ